MRGFFGFAILLLGWCGLALANWGTPVVEELPFTGSGVHLDAGALAIDGAGYLHLIWREARVDTGGQWLLYATNAPDGNWQTPDTINAWDVAYPAGVIAISPLDDTPVIAYIAPCCVYVVRQQAGSWVSTSVADGANGCCPSLAADAAGNLHLTWVKSIGFELYTLAYCAITADGPQPVDSLLGADLGGFGTGASPRIVANEQGKVVIAYRGGDYPGYRVHYAANDGLADTNWVYDQFTTGNQSDYTPSLVYRAHIGLALAISGDDGWGMPAHVYWTWHDSEGGDWAPPQLVSGAFSANSAVIAVTEDGTAQMVSREVSGNVYTGRLLATEGGDIGWITSGIFENVDSEINLVIDPLEYGHVVCVAHDAGLEYHLYHLRSEYPLAVPVAAIRFEPETLQLMASAPDVPVDGTVHVFNVGNLTVTLLANDLDGPFRSFWDWPQVIEPGQSADLPVQFVAPHEGVFYDSLEVTGTPGLDAWLPCYGEFFQTVPEPPVAREFRTDLAPNPFNPVTQLNLELPQATRVTAVVYDRLGRTVATLYSGELATGSHRLTFDGSLLASGLYFVHVQAGAESRVLKAMLLK
jgi:hypothetical protein